MTNEKKIMHKHDNFDFLHDAWDEFRSQVIWNLSIVKQFTEWQYNLNRVLRVIYEINTNKTTNW